MDWFEYTLASSWWPEYRVVHRLEGVHCKHAYTGLLYRGHSYFFMEAKSKIRRATSNTLLAPTPSHSLNNSHQPNQYRLCP